MAASCIDGLVVAIPSKEPKLSVFEAIMLLATDTLNLYGALRLLGYGFMAMVALVVLNVCRQLLLPRKKSEPPTVFHWIPYVGNAVSYGMDPVAFFTKYRAKVCLFYPLSLC